MDTVLGFLVGLIPLSVFCLIFYFVVRKSHESRGGVRHAYYYFVSFLTLAILYWAFSDLIRLVWTQDSNSYSYTYYNSSERFLKAIAGRLSAIIISLPVWAFHWMKATPPQGEAVDVVSRKSYALFVVICTIVIMLATWSFLFYYLITWALGVAETDIARNLPGLISYSIPATALWLWHFNMWRKLNDKADELDISSNNQ